MSEDILKKLLFRFFSGELSEEEKEMLARWINEQEDDRQLNRLLENSWQEFNPAEALSDEQSKKMLEGVFAEVRRKEIKKPGVIRAIFWKRIAVAASVLLCVGTGSYLLLNKSAKQPSVNIAQVKNEIKSPVANRAMIALANGQTIFLDSASNGSLAMQGSVQLVKLADGQIGYEATSGNDKNPSLSPMYNTLSNPRGSNIITMQLSDGSHVWLNAGSSITFPVAFSQNERKVTVDGEAYFEIAHDKSRPFYVSKENVEVKVLGTHFNVNAYGDEPEVRITLLEGSVQVSQTGNSKNTAFLKPGEQAEVPVNDSKAEAIGVQHVNTEQVMAWKNGLFSFEQTGLKDVMRQLSRWYDVEVIYQGETPDLTFGGDIQRTLDLSQILDALSKNGVHFRIEGKKIIVTP